MIAAIQALLQRTIGLDAASVGVSTIEHAVRLRQTACEQPSLAAYWATLCQSDAELQALVETVVVPETWFFRDRAAFAAIARHASEKMSQRSPDAVWRLLSLPCSSGEEAYSMAIALLEAGIPASRFRIDAVDISARALASAQRAVYGTNAFRGDDLGFRDRHFEAVLGGFRPAEAVQRQVRFIQGNLLNPDLLPGLSIYDVIFCRNVLIYCDREAQKHVFQLLHRLLTPEGLLFVGPGETGLLPRDDFTSARMPMAFAFRKAGPLVTPQRSRPARRAAPPVPVSRPALAARPASPPPAAPAREPSIADVQRMADEGHLADAARHCEAYLRSHGPSPQAFYLLGLIRDATNHWSEATEAYRKALYLDRNHREAMVHLALSLERQGDVAGARRLNERIERQAQRSRV